MENIEVVVWGKDGYNPLGLLRQLHDVANVTFLLYGKQKFCAVKSRYCKSLNKTNSLEEGLEWLLSTYKLKERKSFLIMTSDVIAEFVDQNKTNLEPYFYLMGTKESGMLTKVMDKNYMNKLARDCGFLIPVSMECKWDTDISRVKYPCLIKPNKNRRNHGKEFKTKTCENRFELVQVLNSVSKESQFVLQEYIPKQFDALVYGCRTIDGEVIVPGVLMKDRWDIGGDGSHGYLSPEIPHSINIEAIKKFLSIIDYIGLFSAEFGIIDEKAYFYEFNLRNDGTANYFYQAGVNVPLIWILSSLYQDYSKPPLTIDGVHDYIAIVDDFVNVISGKLSFWRWRKDKDKATVFRIYNKDDMAPFYYNIALVAYRLFKNK